MKRTPTSAEKDTFREHTEQNSCVQKKCPPPPNFDAQILVKKVRIVPGQLRFLYSTAIHNASSPHWKKIRFHHFLRCSWVWKSLSKSTEYLVSGTFPFFNLQLTIVCRKVAWDASGSRKRTNSVQLAPCQEAEITMCHPFPDLLHFPERVTPGNSNTKQHHPLWKDTTVGKEATVKRGLNF